MPSTDKAVHISWQDASGGGDITLGYQVAHTADAICMALDEMEASGIDLGAVHSFVIMAMSGAAAEGMLRLGAEFKRQRCAA